MKDFLWLHLIVESCGQLQQYLPPTLSEFEVDLMRQDAILYRLRMIADCANRLTLETKSLSELDWDAIRGFRNVLTHEYHLIDFDRVWDIIHRDLPILEKEVYRLQNEIGKTS